MKIWLSVVVSILFLMSLNHANAQAINIINFPQLVEAVENAEDVRAIIHFDNCILTEPANNFKILRRFSGATTRFNFTQYFHAKERIHDVLIDTVTTSMKILIQSPSGELLILSGRLSVFQDNTAAVHLDFFDPILHKQEFVINWQCSISNEQDNNGLVLFNFF
ncbi:MAG: hypothetical protein HYX60_03945 [Legionella longbeachae]|nr:hypothetical protein [Legionella longbeachae]